MEGFEPIVSSILPFELQNFLSIQGVAQKEDFLCELSHQQENCMKCLE